MHFGRWEKFPPPFLYRENMVKNTVISYPTPAYSNPPIEPQFYMPSQFVISAITLGLTTIITTAINHNYVIAQLVRLLIPSKYGSRGLNEQIGLVISIPAPNQVELNINSSFIDLFIASPTFLPFQQRTLPQILAIGDINSGAINALGESPLATFIPGSFQDISPN